MCGETSIARAESRVRKHSGRRSFEKLSQNEALSRPAALDGPILRPQAPR